MKRLTYISNFSRPLTFEDIEQIGESSLRNNARDELTGALFCFRNIFYQILEGEEEAVDRCYARISRDDRHANVFVLQIERDIATRAYPDWNMKTVVLDERTDSLIRPIKNLLDSLSRTHRILEPYTSEFIRESIQSGENPLKAKSRKVETVVMFSDIVGSTALAEALPVEDFMPLLDHYYEIAAAAVHDAGGDLLKLTGDGLMARFAVERADAALEAALNIQRRLAELRERAEEESPLRLLHAGVGMAAGEAVEGNIGSAQRRDYTLIGDVVNSAARLEGVTRKVRRSVIFDESFARLLSSAAGIKKVGQYRPKGKQASLDIFAAADPVGVLEETGGSIKARLLGLRSVG